MSIDVSEATYIVWGDTLMNINVCVGASLVGNTLMSIDGEGLYVRGW